MKGDRNGNRHYVQRNLIMKIRSYTQDKISCLEIREVSGNATDTIIHIYPPGIAPRNPYLSNS